MKIKKYEPSIITFEVRWLRFITGLAAFILPALVFVYIFIDSRPLESISHLYQNGILRDIFVGLLFIVSVTLIVYKAKEKEDNSKCFLKIICHVPQNTASTIGGIAALLVAYFPTSPDMKNICCTNIIHYSSAVVLFAVLIYFCFCPFRKGAQSKNGRKAKRRVIVYSACGWIMVGSVVVISVNSILKRVVIHYPIASWPVFLAGEMVMLVAFGAAWFAASRFLPFLTGSEEEEGEKRLRLF